MDFTFVLNEDYRFRVNIFFQLNGVSAVFRAIPALIPNINGLNLPPKIKELAKIKKGLILVTGATGSGKSTTLAAMINEINLTESKHILTIEDPVEFIHENKKSLFSQRSVGEETLSFASALKFSLREDPDVILVGEMRDRKTISIAISSAETGHLVMGTLHTSSAAQTISRIVDSFEGGEQVQIRNMLSNSLNAVISQNLLPRKNGERVAIHEILINSPSFGNLIMENKIHQIYGQMQVGQGKTGMITQTQSLKAAIEKKIITVETALQYSTKPEELASQLGLEGFDD